MDITTTFACSIAAATRSLNQRQSVDDTLNAIAKVTRNSVPGFDQIGISTLDKKGEVVTRAALGTLVHRLDDIQYGLWEARA